MATTWNPSDKSAVVTLTGSNLVATASATGGVRSIASNTAGKWYWETTVNIFSSGNTGVGLGNVSAVLSTVGGTPTNAALVYSSGSIWVNNANTGTSIGALGGGVVICHAVDLTGRLYWVRSGAAGNWNGNVANNPATGVGGVNIAAVASSSIASFALAGMTFSVGNPQVVANFGGSAFTGAVPAGFTSGFDVAAATSQARVAILA